MLVDFSVENFGPFRDTATLSLIGAMSDSIHDNLLKSSAVDGGILSSAVIFGPNASGKTFIIKAIRALQAMVAAPVPPGFDYPWYQPFCLSSETVEAPTTITVRAIVDGTLYCYIIAFDRCTVVHESLHGYPGGHKSVIFTRVGNEFRFGRSQSNGQKSISAMTSIGSSYLAVAAQFNQETCVAVHREIVQNIYVLPDERDALIRGTVSMIEVNPDVKDMVIRALEIADLGIVDIKCETKDDSGYSRRAGIHHPFRQFWQTSLVKEDLKVWVEHGFTDTDRSTVMPLEKESEGTWQMLGIMGPLVDALMYGKTIVIDEFGSNLHPLVGRWLISMFNESRNPHHAQLVAVTNDHTLLDTKTLLRKDQIYFTHKDPYNGASILYSLFDCDEDWSDDDLSVRLPKLYHPVPYISDEELLKRPRQY
ncbi:MAG: ATP-binding protein [Thermoplasmata archaeon]|nr:ATP-binding protein [Thermoplasmata archaeon]